VPGRTTSELNTLVNLEPGQSVILAGLVSASTRESVSGVPGLSQIPIFGLLFGKQQRRMETSQNLLLIVPSVVDSVSMVDQQRIGRALSTYWDYSGKTKKAPLMPKPMTAPSALDPELR